MFKSISMGGNQGLQKDLAATTLSQAWRKERNDKKRSEKLSMNSILSIQYPHWTDRIHSPGVHA
jgi:hypothetical protein